jgi:hypothetical protein
MQNKRRSFKPSSLMVVAFLAILLALVVLAAILILRDLNRARVQQNMPPSVIVHSPIAGQSATAGSFLLAHITATGQNPVFRVELWVDGEPLETQTPDPAMGEVTTFDVTSDLLVTEGPHMFFARAVDTDGLVGQSLPIPIQGDPPLAEGEASVVVVAEEGETLQEIADVHRVDVGTLQELNPGLGDGGLPADAPVVVPFPPDQSGDGSPSQPQPPSGDVPSQPSPGQTQPQPPGVVPPAAPLPVPPPGVPSLQVVKVAAIDIRSLIPILLSNRPKAPTSLQAGVENCKVRLQWHDNADNETHFKVWMQGLGMPPRVIATLQGSPITGPAWYEFASPQVGIYSFWIEAVNALGGQPSEIQWVAITNLGCPPALATHLEIEALDMDVASGYDRVYCYLSLEGTPEKRIPADDSAFIQVSDGRGNIANWAAGDKRLLLPIPTDDEVTLGGECWGWQGMALNKLGAFQASTPRALWDGSRQTLTGANFTIGYRILPFGSVDSAGMYAFYDYTIDAPYGLWVEILKPSPFVPDYENPNIQWPTLHWKWDGDQTKLSGFTVFMNGNPLMQVPPSVRAASIHLPTSCGAVYEFKVAANYWNAAMSVGSPSLKHDQGGCQVYAEVLFEWITFAETDDGWTFPVTFENCDQIQIYYDLFINATGHPNVIKSFWGGSFFKPIACGKYYFWELASPIDRSPDSDRIVVPIDPPLPNSSYGGIALGGVFWDHDSGSSDDLVAVFRKTLMMPIDSWVGFDRTFEEFYTEGESYGVVRFRVKGYRIGEPARSANPGIGP